MTTGIFAERLKKLLTESSMKQNELARRARITEAALSRYLNDGRVPRIDIVANLATVLNTTTDYLLGHADKSDEDISFLGIKRLIARGARTMTHEEKMELINIIFGKDNNGR